MPVQLVAAGVDLNDDGLGDIVVTVGTAGQNNRPVCELVMISGSNGQKVWSHKLLMPFSQSNGQALPRAVK